MVDNNINDSEFFCEHAHVCSAHNIIKNVHVFFARIADCVGAFVYTKSNNEMLVEIRCNQNKVTFYFDICSIDAIVCYYSLEIGENENDE